MAKYRKKPVTIEAIQYTGTNGKQVEKFANGKVYEIGYAHLTTDPPNLPFLQVDTLEGRMTGSVGDFIIRGVNGEFYPCKPDIFEKTYEKVNE